MKTLAINTALKKTSIALIDGNKVVSEKTWLSNSNEAEKLMPEIAKLLKSKKVKYEDLKSVLLIKGPGSFTGLRIGVTVANTIAHLQKIPVYAATTFQYLWAAHTANAKTTHGPLVLFAGKKEIYIQLTKTSKPILKKLDEAKEFFETKKLTNLHGALTDDQKKEFKAFKFKESKKPAGKIFLSLKKLEKGTLIKPFYVKGPAISKPKPQPKKAQAILGQKGPKGRNK
ncbi:tRNA (adenosine(37)-N6)-threonylcarbamoyltransferase complex dimerization subunit type 1 TsaB [Candidatus Peregrinibacteria bacterium]|jgi:tRNA threonylcarbamoyl adenosine modification protein YeaZ|nr:tRNA (adenosine(37)-N6)-threonylcarbamoyltransferase complex dimerization subunit type 1 TsaB [Candidatus Peregrinibacteria bacterium]MBT4056065.1 tRNA (adenosine(37)-N6)-threonylcarbamoyltransferase complex dimerization subunit type 1 TsaB [Candidatus Peregrinibacteria bacterium]